MVRSSVFDRSTPAGLCLCPLSTVSGWGGGSRARHSGTDRAPPPPTATPRRRLTTGISEPSRASACSGGAITCRRPVSAGAASPAPPAPDRLSVRGHRGGVTTDRLTGQSRGTGGNQGPGVTARQTDRAGERVVTTGQGSLRDRLTEPRERVVTTGPYVRRSEGNGEYH